jgi:putative CocE/NonD family hydrolase
MTPRGTMALCALIAAASLSGSPAEAAAPQAFSPAIAMPDGVRLAADVVLPTAPPGSRHPAVLLMTRYGRATRLSQNAVRALTASGLALVFVDMRGSGASQGHVDTVFDAKERGDIGPILDWIARQPWSDGRVISTGASYDGNLAALAVASNNPALVAAAPRFIDFDTYRDLAIPGGVRGEMFLKAWGDLTDQLDAGAPCLAAAAACASAANLKPVDGDADYGQLRAALRDHAGDWRAYAETRHYAFEDDRTASGHALRDGFLSSQIPALSRSRAPVQLWGSWFDASTADSALDWWRAAPGAPMEVYLGAWTHGGGARVDPFIKDAAEDEPNAPSVARDFLDFAGRAMASPPAVSRVIHYYTAGAAVWRTTPQWPPANVAARRWFFAASNRLELAAPTASIGADRYAVDFAATSGKTNRWTTQLGGGPVDYGDRRGADAALLNYTSAPLAGDIEVTGAGVVSLHMASSRSDGAVLVYLETVAPDGRVVYLSEGELRLPLRGPATAANVPPGVAPSFIRADAAPLKPRQMIEVGVRLHAVSAMIPKGYRLRVAIAGADADSFARYPPRGDATYTVFRTSAAPSYVDLPQADWRAGATAVR